jgi:tetratricopeptide (TPR) repeat protein
MTKLSTDVTGIKRITLLLFCLCVMLVGCTREASVLGSSPDVLDAGWDKYRLGEFRSAALAFQQGLDALPAGEALHTDFRFGLATVWNLRLPVSEQDKERASELYEQILADDASHALAPWSALALARMVHLVPVGDVPDYDAVRAAYLTRVMQPYGETLAAEEATVYFYSTYLTEAKSASAAKAREGLERFLAENPTSTFCSGAHALAALACEQLDDGDAQLAHALKALETMEHDPTDPFYDYASRYWKLATTAEFQAGDFETARRFYLQLIDEYPADVRAFPAQLSLDRMDALEARLRAELGGTP